jgi:hypothetical protein
MQIARDFWGKTVQFRDFGLPKPLPGGTYSQFLKKI